MCQGVAGLWSVTVSRSVYEPVQQTQCVSVLPDLYGIVPPRLSPLCQLSANGENGRFFQFCSAWGSELNLE